MSRKAVSASLATAFTLLALITPSLAFCAPHTFPDRAALGHAQPAGETARARGSVGAQGNARIVPPNSVVGGRTLDQWAAAWTQWAFSHSQAVGVYDDGTNFGLDQSGPVWFVQPGCNDRVCNLPAGVFLMAPTVFGWNDYPCPDPGFAPAPGQSLDDFLVGGMNDILDGVPQEFLDGAFGPLLEVDGVAVQNVAAYRAVSSMFTMTIDPSWQAWDACVTGEPQQMVAGGWYVILPPLSPGTHTVTYPLCGTTITLNVAGGGAVLNESMDSRSAAPAAAANAKPRRTWGALKQMYR